MMYYFVQVFLVMFFSLKIDSYCFIWKALASFKGIVAPSENWFIILNMDEVYLFWVRMKEYMETSQLALPSIFWRKFGEDE